MIEKMKCKMTSITEPENWLEQWKAFAKANGLKGGMSELIGLAVNEYISRRTGKKPVGKRPTRGSGAKKAGKKTAKTKKK